MRGSSATAGRPAPPCRCRSFPRGRGWRSTPSPAEAGDGEAGSTGRGSGDLGDQAAAQAAGADHDSADRAGQVGPDPAQVGQLHLGSLVVGVRDVVAGEPTLLAKVTECHGVTFENSGKIRAGPKRLARPGRPGKPRRLSSTR